MNQIKTEAPIEHRKAVRRALKELRDYGRRVSINAIAREAGLTWTQAKAAIEAAGIDATDRERTKRNAKILKLRDKGKTYAAIASAVGLSRQRVHQIVAREAANT